MLRAMKEMVDSFWRAAAYCLHPKVILLSLLPLLLSVAAVLGLGWFYWESAVAGVRESLEQWSLVLSFLQWLESIGAAGFNAVLAPLIVVALAVPVIVVASLLLVAWLMTPALVNLVAARRFPTLERRRGAGWVSAGCALPGLHGAGAAAAGSESAAVADSAAGAGASAADLGLADLQAC